MNAYLILLVCQISDAGTACEVWRNPTIVPMAFCEKAHEPTGERVAIKLKSMGYNVHVTSGCVAADVPA